MSVNIHIIEVDDLVDMEHPWHVVEQSTEGIRGLRFIDVADVVLVKHRGVWHSIKPPRNPMPNVLHTTEVIR
jgi:hypothetical protein